MERHNDGPRLRAAPQASARRPTSAEQQRRYRSEGPHGNPAGELIWSEAPVNGRPFKPYRYRGTGPFADEEW